jgi:hypothetical protein
VALGLLMAPVARMVMGILLAALASTGAWCAQRMRTIDLPPAGVEFGTMAALDLLDPGAQAITRPIGQQCCPIMACLAAADANRI